MKRDPMPGEREVDRDALGRRDPEGAVKSPCDHRVCMRRARFVEERSADWAELDGAARSRARAPAAARGRRRASAGHPLPRGRRRPRPGAPRVSRTTRSRRSSARSWSAAARPSTRRATRRAVGVGVPRDGLLAARRASGRGCSALAAALLFVPLVLGWIWGAERPVRRHRHPAGGVPVEPRRRAARRLAVAVRRGRLRRADLHQQHPRHVHGGRGRHHARARDGGAGDLQRPARRGPRRHLRARRDGGALRLPRRPPRRARAVADRRVGDGGPAHRLRRSSSRATARACSRCTAEARPAVELVLGTMPWLVLAGLVEGFFTGSGPTLVPSLVVGIALGAVYWALVMLRRGRFSRRYALTHAAASEAAGASTVRAPGARSSAAARSRAARTSTATARRVGAVDGLGRLGDASVEVVVARAGDRRSRGGGRGRGRPRRAGARPSPRSDR